MNLQTEKLLATLEVITNCSHLFLFETAHQGEFNLWNLIRTEGFVTLTDIELAFEYWQNIEEWGTPTNQTNYEYAPLRSKRKNENWSNEIKSTRQGYYQQLQDITQNLHNVRAYNLSVPKSAPETFEWDHPYFYVPIVVGSTIDNNWLCLAPTVPDQVSYRNEKHNSVIQITCEEYNSETSQELIAQIQPLLDKLSPISIYGYYYGGYNYIYQHHITGAIAKSKAKAIELALQNAIMVVIKQLTVGYDVSDSHNSYKLSQFMNECLNHPTLYDLSFWDIGYTYKVGQTPAGDWIGVWVQSEFEYNP